MKAKTKKLATSGTVTGIRDQVNNYFYSNSYMLAWEFKGTNGTAQIYNYNGVLENFNVTKKSNKFTFNQITK